MYDKENDKKSHTQHCFISDKINRYLINNQDIPKQKPFRPSGETNILPG